MLVDTSDGCKYMGQSDLAAMLAVKRLAGVALEVNLRNSAQARKHASESTLALKPRADVTRSPKQGYQWPHKKDMCPPKIFKKKKKNHGQSFQYQRPSVHRQQLQQTFGHKICMKNLHFLYKIVVADYPEHLYTW